MYRKFAWYRYLFQRWNQLSRLQRSTIYLVLSVILVYIVYLYNQNLPPTGRPKVKASIASGREKWPPKFGDQERLPDMNGAVTDKANINGGADNEEHNAAVEEEQQDKQQAGQNDVDFDGGDSNNAVENRVEDGAAEKKFILFNLFIFHFLPPGSGPRGKMNVDPCGSGSTALEYF